MLDPYRMVAIDVVLFSFTISGIFFYRFIFPKKNISFLLLLFIFSLLPIISILRKGSYESGDFVTHVYRNMQFFQLLASGNFLPSWAGLLNATYGYPLFIFLNPLPYYLQSFFHYVGFSFIASLKLLLILSYVCSGLFFYLWAKREIKNSFAAFCGSIIYLFTPYHLVDLHFRVAIGEVVFFCFLPLFFYTLTFLQQKSTLVNILLVSITFSFLMFSHQAMTIFSLGVTVPYLIFSYLRKSQSVKHLLTSFGAIALGFIYSAYIWVPHLIYPRFTLAYLLTKQTVIFPKLYELFFSPWMMGFLFQGHKGELSYLIGYTQIIVLLGSIYFLLKNKFTTKYFYNMLFWLILCIGVIFMMTSYSAFLWNSLPILNTAQFSTRFLLIFTFCIAAQTVYLSYTTRKHKVLWTCLIVFSIVYTLLNWGHRRMLPQINDDILNKNLPYSTSQGEGFCCMGQPKWTLPDKEWMAKLPKEHVEIISGKGQIKQLIWQNSYHQYIVYNQESINIKENTWYFPGWHAYIDKHEIPVIPSKHPLSPGLITFGVPQGIHLIELRYTDLPILFFTKIISIWSFFTSLALLLIIFLKKHIL